MKAIRLNTMTQKIFLGVFFLTVLCSFTVKAKKVNFLTSSVVPAARGFVKIGRDKNRNYNIKIKLSYLTEVSRLQTARLTYVVWMVTEEDIVKNMGQIESSVGMFSKKLKASFETATSFKPVRIFLTAEDDPSMQYPGDQVIISTDRFSK
jgi:hypothetical protein